MKRIVFAYSGAHETPSTIPWLLKSCDEVVTVTLDLGQGGELEGIRNRAMAEGAARAHVLDRREAYVRDFVDGILRAVDSSALTSMAVAQALVHVAEVEGTDTVACGTGTGLAALVYSLKPSLKIVKVPARLEQPRQANTTAARAAIHEPALVEIGFERGLPVAINGVRMALVELADSLCTIAGGRPYPFPGTPAADVLQTAYEALQKEAPALTGAVPVHLLDGTCRIDAHPVRAEADARQLVAAE